MRVADGTQYILQKGDEGYLFVPLTDSSLPEGEIQVFRYTYDGEIWRSFEINGVWCDGIHPTNYARELWGRVVAEGFVQNKSGLFVAVDGTVA